MDGRTLFSGVGKGYSPRCTYSVGGEPFIIQGKAGDGEAPTTSFSTVSLIGNFSSPLTNKMTGSSFFPANNRK